MAEANKELSVFVTGGAEDLGLAAVRALLKRGHKVFASACTSEGALALRLAGALPVYPDLGRASEVLSALRMARADAIVNAIPQFCGGLPYSGESYAARGDQLVRFTRAIADAALQHGVRRIVSLSFGYLYEAGPGAAQEGDSRRSRQRLRAHAGGRSCAEGQRLERLHCPQRLYLWRQKSVNRSARRCDKGVPALALRFAAGLLDTRR